MMYRTLLVCAMLAGICTPTKAGELLVNDPKALHAALKTSKPGDVLILAEGEWRDVKLRIRATGTAEEPVVVRAAVPGKTVFNGDTSLAISGQFVVVHGFAFRAFRDDKHIVSFRTNDDEPAEDCRLTNVSIDKPITTDNDADAGSYWVSIYGRRNRVDHCYFEGKRTASPTLTVWVNPDGDDRHRIDHNLFAGRPALGKNGGETMRIGTSQVSMASSKTVVEDNHFEKCNGESEIISNKSCDNIYRRNVFVECQGGLVLRHGNRCVVDGNWFFGHDVQGTGGIRIIGEDHRITNNYLSQLNGELFESAMPFCDGIPDSAANGYFQVKRAVIAHNTIVDCRQSMIFGVGTGARGRSQPAVDVTVANNLIVSDSAPLITVLNQPKVLWIGNIVWGGETGVEADAGIRRVDPMLKAATDRFRVITEQSPARRAAAVLDPPVETDISGRPRGTLPDVGCQQFDAANPPSPPGKREVGPAWMAE